MANLTDFSPDEIENFFGYLDALRESAVTNMYGARPYLQDAFDLEGHEASTVLMAWMRTLDGDEGAGARAARALEQSAA